VFYSNSSKKIGAKFADAIETGIAVIGSRPTRFRELEAGLPARGLKAFMLLPVKSPVLGDGGPQAPQRGAELLQSLHLRHGGPMEAIPVDVLPGQLSPSLVNPVRVSRLLRWSPSDEV